MIRSIKRILMRRKIKTTVMTTEQFITKMFL
jgi:hypothetical protein